MAVNHPSRHKTVFRRRLKRLPAGMRRPAATSAGLHRKAAIPARGLSIS
jgi:hypothetical protein